MATKPFLSQIAVPVGTTTGDVYYPQTSLLMHFNGTNGSTTMTDNSKNNVTVTATNGAAISTAQSKFGGSSVLFDGTNDYVSTTYNTALFDWWTVDYTLEMWVYAISFPAATGSGGSIGNLIGNMSFNGDTNYWSFGTNSSGNVKFYYYNGSAQSFTSNLTLTLNTWTHLAMVKSSVGVDIYVNGVKSSTTHTIVGTPQSSTNTAFTIGAYTNGFYQGYIDELRITKGIARYTSNFTPSTTQFLDSTGDANSTVVVNSTATGFAIGTGGINGAQLAKAWVNFNGQGTVAIRDSYNVSSITDLGTGQYLVNFSTARSNANYVHFINVAGNSDSPSNSFTGHTGNNSYSQTTTYAVVASRFNGALYDNWEISSIVFSN
jgi:hypothetical protein